MYTKIQSYNGFPRKEIKFYFILLQHDSSFLYVLATPATRYECYGATPVATPYFLYHSQLVMHINQKPIIIPL